MLEFLINDFADKVKLDNNYLFMIYCKPRKNRLKMIILD